eukprot:266001-Rhodomonas_salina.1
MPRIDQLFARPRPRSSPVRSDSSQRQGKSLVPPFPTGSLAPHAVQQFNSRAALTLPLSRRTLLSTGRLSLLLFSMNGR